MKRDPRERWAEDDDHDQHLKLGWVRALRRHRPDAGMPLGEFVARAMAATESDWSRLTRREKMRERRTVSIESLLHEPTTPSFLPSILAAAEVASLMEQLSPREQLVVLAILAAGRSPRDVGRELGISAKAVRAIKDRAIEKARRQPRKR